MTEATTEATTWMIYGANGYSARLIADYARRRGHTPILAGRHPQRVLEAAEQAGLPARIFDLDRPEQAARNLEGVRIVLNCAGPFSATARAMLAACMQSGTHYLDITGEIDVFEMVHAQDAALRTAGVTAIPGVGFDVVPTDCLAAMLKAKLPDAVSLRLAFHTRGGRLSPGTAKTMVEGLGQGGRVRQDGRIVAVPAAHAVAMIPFDGHTPEAAVAIPWGDVSTAWHTTGIPNITVFLGAPKAQIRSMRVLRLAGPLLRLPPVQAALKRRIERRIKGPSDERRARSHVDLWGEAESPSGRKATIRLKTPEGYSLTAEAAVKAVERLLAGGVPAGALTPARAFGPGFLRELSGVEIGMES